MLTTTARKKILRQTHRVEKRLNAEDLLGRAEFLPEMDRLLLEQVLSHGVKLKSLARIHRTTPLGLARRIRRIRARLVDPCFLLTTHFSRRLPEQFRPIAHSYFIDHLTLRECAARHHTSLHHIRSAITAVRSYLVFAREKYLVVPKGD